MNKDCRRALLNLDAELDATQTKWQNSHMASCDPCRAEAAGRERVQMGLRRAVKSRPADTALEQQVKASLAPTPVQRRWQPYAAAAALLIAVGAYWIGRAIENRLTESAYFQSLPESVSRIMRVGLSDHVHCAAFRKFRKPPAAEELPAPFRPVLAHVPAGYRVLAAHECKAQGRSFIHLVMRGTEEKTVSLVMARKQAGETFASSSLRRVAGSSVFTEEVPQFQIAGFEADSFLVFVVSDLAGSKNQQLASTLAGPLTSMLNKLS
jgi:anti-sigma factor RsiW